VLVGLALPMWSADRTATISGYVRNGQGVPQMGAVVDVLGTALRTFRVFTDDQGFFAATASRFQRQLFFPHSEKE
jgi:hypothetical protein